MPEKKENGFFEGVGKFFRSVVAELKKVNWPSRRETFVYTVVVIVTCLVLATVLGVFDILFKFLYDIAFQRA